MTPTITDEATATTPGRVGGVVDQLIAAGPQVVEQIELANLAAHPDNPRGDDLGDLTDLAASVASSGILEPLIVVPVEAFNQGQPETGPFAADPARYVVIAGHRRLAAADLAGQATVPCIIRADLAGAAGIAMMLIENMQRQGLSAMKEADGFGLLRSKPFGWSQQQIADTVGVHQSHVSKRLNLLKLPFGLRVRVEEKPELGGLTIDQAVTVARQPAEVRNEIAEAIAGESSPGGGRIARLIEGTIDDYQRRSARRAAAKAVRDAGVTVLHLDGDEPTDEHVNYSRTDGPAPLNWLYPNDSEQWLAHAELPCHAAVIHPHRVNYDDKASAADRYTSYVCTDPAAHKTETEPIPAGVRDEPIAPSPEDEAAERLAAEDREAQEARRGFMTAYLRRTPDRSAQHHLLSGFAIDSLIGYMDNGDRTGSAAGLLYPNGETPLEPIVQMLDSGVCFEEGATKWALAIRLSADDADLEVCMRQAPEDMLETSAPIGRFHLSFLAAAGYELHSIEQRFLDGTDALTFRGACRHLDLLGLVPESDITDPEGNDES